jgi:hypothetical protein
MSALKKKLKDIGTGKGPTAQKLAAERRALA